MKINQRQLAKTLKESAIAPNKPGPINIMIKSGDSRYLMQRAVELCKLAISSPTPGQQVDYLKKAISILGISRFCLLQICSDSIANNVTKHTHSGPEVNQSASGWDELL